MKYATLAIAATTLVSAVNAFPRMTAEQLQSYQEQSRKTGECPFAKKTVKEVQQEEGGCPFAKQKARRSSFNPEKQLIDVKGEHTFQPPNFAAGDQRGPCPGLNALANHNYLPHNGVADIPTIIDAVNKVYSMSLDLGTFLALYGTAFDGNPLSLDPGYSIGGPAQGSVNILGGLGLLGTPTGLSGSHNKYESDVSPTRGDLYLEGNNFHVQRDRFIDYWNALLPDTPAPQQYSALSNFHYQRFDQSVNLNPYFFYSPFAGILVSPAGYSFPPRMMANHSEEYTDGYLSREVFTSFFGVTGDNPDNFVVNQGWERIPENWYKRPAEDPYSIPDFLVDVLEHAAEHPRLLSFGGNTGMPNSYSSIDITNLTGGVFELTTLLEGNNLECFALQSIMAAAPDALGTTFSDVGRALKPLTDNIQQLLAGKGCPQLYEYNQALFNEFPGYTQSYGNYKGQSSENVDDVQTLLKNTLKTVTSQLGNFLGGAGII